ncbi:MAG: hypothetical protein ACPGUV_06210 [Polyangiales bacterium]
MTYRGPERRIHRVFVTRNTEYHLRRDRCIAVRDRQSGTWYDCHRALHRRVVGSLRFNSYGSFRARTELPEVGECMCFDGTDLVTSEVSHVARPSFDTVAHYPAVAVQQGCMHQ